MSASPIGLLLAAGQSRRFGNNKLLHPLNDGTPMVIAAAQTLCAALPTCIAVVNDNMPAITKQLEQLGMQVVINGNAEAGIGNSIACGVSASDQSSGWIIALADMPYIKVETITLLANKLSDGANIVAPVYQQQRGHPVGFNKQFRDELLQLNADIGARNIIAKHQEDLELIETHDRSVITDIDSIADLQDSNAINEKAIIT